MTRIELSPYPEQPPRFRIPRHGPRAPHEVSILVGEAIQAMRRALDYLVYEIAFLDSGIEQDDTQFPVDQSPRRFWARRERNSRGLDDHSCYLVGVSNEHAGALQRDQPYSGASWTERLARLSNPDKHRHLTVTQHQTKMRVAR